MICELAQTSVHGYFDGELDAIRAAEFEHHVETCADCQLAMERMDSLRTRLRRAGLYEHASEQLREQIHTALEPQAAIPAPAVWSWRKFLVPAFAILVVAVALSLFWSLPQRRGTEAVLTAELIDAHVRSLQPGHLTDVQSTDQHTVKPWFDGKLAFIPPVTDYSSQGFPLLGGRLDVIGGENIAALVYGRRKHVINLFVWHAPGRESPAEKSGTQQGYNWSMWRAGEMQYCLISDVSPADLDTLEDLIRR